jgi:hypothetical protein
MLQIQTANLPRDQQQRVHADFLDDEQAYLKMRDSLLDQFRGQWVAIQRGKVIAANKNLFAVMEKASACGGHPFVALVGAEDATVFRVRRTVFPYDSAYQPFALPRVIVTYWNHSQTRSQTHGDVIPDTGSDVSLLPDADCLAINLYQSPYLTGLAGGAVGGGTTALFYQGKVEIDGRFYSALIQPVPNGKEHILGRDVLNQERVLFDGPAGQVVIDP